MIRNFLKKNLFSFGIHHFFKTVGRYKVMKDDSIGSGLPEYQTFLLAAFYMDPIFHVLAYFSTQFCMVPFVVLVTSYGSSSNVRS